MNEIQDELAVAAATGELPIDDLYELLLDEHLLKLAALKRISEITNGNGTHRVLRQIGREARRLRADSALLAQYIDLIRSQLLQHHYSWKRPTPMRAGKRLIWIRPLKDQILEMAIVMLLGPIVEPQLVEQNLGWRKGRSALMAKATVEEALLYEDYNWVIRLDVEDCFQTVPQRAVIRDLHKLIDDKAFIRLIKSLITLTSGKEKGKGIAPGTISAPIMVNLFLHGLDLSILSLGTFLGPATTPKPSVPATRRITVGPVALCYARYCDDLVVLVEGDRAQAQNVRALIAQWLVRNGMQLNERKEHIGPVTMPFDFVSFSLSRVDDPDPGVIVDISKARLERLAGDLIARLAKSTDPVYRRRVKKRFRRQQGAYFKAGGAPLPDGFFSAVDAASRN